MSIPAILIDQESLPTQYDIRAYAGCDYCLPLHLQADVSGTVADVNLTGVTYALKVSTKRAGTALVSAAVTATDATTGVYITGLITGGARVQFAKAELATASVGVWFWNLLATFPAGHAQFAGRTLPIIEGEFEVKAGATA